MINTVHVTSLHLVTTLTLSCGSSYRHDDRLSTTLSVPVRAMMIA